MKLGEALSYEGVDNNETIFIIIIFGIFLSEAILAASLTPQGEQQASPIGRLIAHMLISFGGTIASITAVRDITSCFIPGLGIVQRTVNIFISFVLMTIAIMIPIWNMELIASGLGADIQLQLFFYDKLYSDETMVKAREFYGLTPNYDAWAQLPYLLKATVVGTYVHYSFTLLEGLRNIGSPVRFRMLVGRLQKEHAKAEEMLKKSKEEAKKDDTKKKDDKKDDKRTDNNAPYVPMEAEKRQGDAAEANLEYLLKRLRLTGDDLTRTVKNAYAAYIKITPEQGRYAVAANIAGLVNDCKTTDGISDSAEKATKKKELEEKIRTFFKASPKEDDFQKRGLGMTIKKP